MAEFLPFEKTTLEIPVATIRNLYSTDPLNRKHLWTQGAEESLPL